MHFAVKLQRPAKAAFHKFRLLGIDYPTLERVPKDSFYWYRDFIAGRRGAPRPSPVATG